MAKEVRALVHNNVNWLWYVDDRHVTLIRGCEQFRYSFKDFAKTTDELASWRFCYGGISEGYLKQFIDDMPQGLVVSACGGLEVTQPMKQEA